MPNYKSKMLTFLSIGEMTSLLLDNTDEDGLLFAVATDSTNFKIVMWRKNSTATVDNETVYPANGPGRWHVLPVRESEVVTVIGDNLPSSIGPETEIIIQKKSDGSNVLKGRFNGIFEDVASGGGGNGDSPVKIIWGTDISPPSLPSSPEEGKHIYIQYELGPPPRDPEINFVSSVFSGKWMPFSAMPVIYNKYSRNSSGVVTDIDGLGPSKHGSLYYKGTPVVGKMHGQMLVIYANDLYDFYPSGPNETYIWNSNINKWINLNI